MLDKEPKGSFFCFISMFILRNYQEKAVKSGLEFLQNKKKKSKGLLILPTGAGKSIIIATICKELDGKVLIFQPSKELLQQNVAKFKAIGGECSIYSASANEKILSNVTFATIGSVQKLGKEFKEHGFKYVIIDEAHLVSKKKSSDEASMYQKFFFDLGVNNIIGLTATPFRNHVSGNRFKSFTCAKFLTRTSPKFFNEVIHITQIQEMIENNFWKPFDYRYYPFDSSTLRLNTTGGDYTKPSLESWFKTTNLPELVSDCVTTLLNKKNKKSILIFVPSIEIAEILSQRIEGSTFVHGNLSSKDRELRLSKFAEGEYHTMINCEILTTGYDNSEIDAILMCRPCQSLSLYLQMIGRLVRVSKNNKKGLVVEFTDNTDRFGRVHDLTIDYVENFGWGVFTKAYNQKNVLVDKLLTGVDLNDPVVVTKKSLIKQGIFEKNNKSASAEEYILDFGEHKNKKIKEIPEQYLQWCLNNLSNKKHLLKKITEYLQNKNN